MYQSDIVKGGGFTLPPLPEVFNLYHSGSNTKGSSIVVKFLILFFILLFICIAIFSLFISSFKSNVEPHEEKPINYSSNNSSIISSSSDINNTIVLKSNPTNSYYFYNIKCYVEKCYIDKTYKYFDTKYLYHIIKTFPPIFATSQKKIKLYTELTLVFNKPIFENLKIKEDRNEQVNFSMFNPSSTSPAPSSGN